ncbi:hypothetical protein QUS97_22610, partial [Xanthomonas citri pv. citri]
GQSWGSAGTAGDTVTYRSRFRADAGPDGCLLVMGEISYRTVTTGQQRVVTTQRTWCAGRGLVGQIDTVGADRVVTGQLSTPPGMTAETVDEPFRWPDPQTWQVRDRSTVSSNRQWGEQPMLGAAANGIRPVRTRSGLVIRAMMTPTDLVGTRRRGP